ncbi:hypothetical protein IMZ08_15300 [Bacillus luteolus]|uniref:Uncharacterized protein n=1 Tax=Litchfieldia luteola TaxID=682179 RepID=A0ABR9QLP7_9BACI|nr:hypothetical protein [Cytobacillus luteolus]MBE4909417.1 hypothetical protein [Cytobacillus luteolus]MBP1940817.1 ribosome maturation factor RimP [Cytobacillus luteolus]
MEEENVCEGFNCPEFVPADAPDDFCIPEECCPPRIKQPMFPAPTSCLPEEQQEELEARIKQANQLLLDLGLSGERTPDEIFQRAFDGLVGQKVRVEINCPVSEEVDRNIIKRGRVMLVGFDFVVLRNKNGKEIIIPFEVVNTIKLNGRFAEPNEESELTEIDPCFRRRLTFRFGETVSSSPELIQIFFRLRLKIYLMLLVNKRLKVRLEGEKIKGTLFDVHRETLTLKIKKKKKKKKKKMEIPLNNICYLVVL